MILNIKKQRFIFFLYIFFSLELISCGEEIKKHNIFLITTRCDGLMKGSKVIRQGIEVGTIEEIDLINNSEILIELNFKDLDFRLSPNVLFHFKEELIGDTRLEIIDSNLSENQNYFDWGDTIRKNITRRKFEIDDFIKVLDSFKEVLDNIGDVTNATFRENEN